MNKKDATFLNTTERGFFDPITLGIFVPTDFNKLARYTDETSFCDSATFFHELSHYLQFYGTTFGVFYLKHVHLRTTMIVEMLRVIEKRDKFIQTPAYRYEIDINSLFQAQNEREIFTQSLLSNRYFLEELYGHTYPHMDPFKPIIDEVDGKPLITSILHLRQNDDFVLPITGQILIENQACLNETSFLISHSPSEVCNNILQRNYVDLPERTASIYLGLSRWLVTIGLQHIEDLLYFILLNQPQFGYISRLGDYSIAKNIKQILINSSKLKGIKKPKSENEIEDTVENICNLTNLENPFKVISEFRDILKKQMKNKHTSFVFEWVAYEIFSWILSNKYEAIRWPEQPNSILDSIPILKVHFDSDKNYNYAVLRFLKQSPNKELLYLISAHNTYTEHVHLVHGFFYGNKTRCPKYIQSKPKLCNSCEVCSGYIPDSLIEKDCPVISIWQELGFNKLPEENI